MSLINIFVAARQAYARWRDQQRAYDELMALDDRSLADIGIHRSQIPGIVANACQQARSAQLPAAIVAPAFGPRHAPLGGDD
jgi:uncharacterized protein YjiS (DUF1127 family)